MNQRKGENDRRNHFMINLHESMGPDQDRTRDPWICSQTRICSKKSILCFMGSQVQISIMRWMIVLYLRKPCRPWFWGFCEFCHLQSFCSWVWQYMFKLLPISDKAFWVYYTHWGEWTLSVGRALASLELVWYRIHWYIKFKLQEWEVKMSDNLDKCNKANLKNIFVSPYPTLFYRYGSVGRKENYFILLPEFDTH